MEEESSPVWRILRRLIVLAVLGAIYWFVVLPMIQWCMVGQHPLLEALRTYLAQNFVGMMSSLAAHINWLVGALGLLGVGFITTRPKLWPKAWQDWYEWIGNATESALPGRFRNNHDQLLTPPPPKPTPPEEPAQSVKE